MGFLEIKQRIHVLDSMGHNWWSVCVSGAGVGVLALLSEDSRAADWLKPRRKSKLRAEQLYTVKPHAR